MDENNRNFILAIVLSIGVLFAWQFFFVPKHPPPVKPAEQTQPVEPGPPQPQAGGRDYPGRGAATRRRHGRDDDPRGGPGAEPAHRHRHAEPQGLDRAEGRPHRRSDAEGLSRDGRAGEPDGDPPVAGGRARRLLRRAWLRRRHRRPGPGASHCRHAVDGGHARTADAKLAGHARLTTTARDSNSPAPSRSTTNICSRVDDTVANSGSEAITLYPYALVSRHEPAVW